MPHTRRRSLPGLVLLLAMALAGPALPARAARPEAPRRDPAPVPAPRVASQPCRDLLVVGVRGSGEKPPFGRTVGEVHDALLQRFTGSHTSAYLDYPAVDPHSIVATDVEELLLDDTAPEAAYFASVGKGVAELARVLADSARRCPRQQVVLVGFSQGAQVIDATLAAGNRPSQLAGSLLLGNPDHYPGQSVQELDHQVATPAMGLSAAAQYLRASTHPTTRTTRRQAVNLLLREVFDLYEGAVSTDELAGVLRVRGKVLAPANYATTYSVCAVDDMVCDAAPALSRLVSGTSTLEQEFARTRPVHGGYHAEDARRSIDAVLATLAQRTGKVRAPAAGQPSALLTPRPRLASASPTPSAQRSPRASAAQVTRTGGERVPAGVLVLGAVGCLAAGFVLGRATVRRRGRR